MNRDNIFGEVRSLLGRREHDSAWAKQLLELAMKAKREDPEFHGEQLVPYIEGQRIDWPEPLLDAGISTIEAFREALPMATFGLDLRDILLVGEPEPDYLPYFDGKKLKLRQNNRVLANVSKLHLDTRLLVDPAAEALFHAPEATALRDLTIQNHDTHPRSVRFLFEDTLDAICTAPSAPFWRRLAIRQSSLTSELSKRFFSNFPGDSLRTLDLSRNYIRYAPETTPTWLAQLEQLDLSRCNLEADGIAKLLSGQRFTNLEKLSVSNNSASGKGIEALRGDGRFPKLRELEVGGCMLETKDIETLLSLDLPALERLPIIQNTLDADALEMFITSPFTRHFQGFELSLTNTDLRAFKPLLAHPNLETFHTLTLGLASQRVLGPFHGARQQTQGARRPALDQEKAALVQDIITGVDPEHMRVLVLAGHPINKATARHIARMENIEHLDLHNALIEPDALHTLLSAAFSNLSFANFRALGIDDDMIATFLGGAAMENLEHLVLAANNITNDGATLLAAMNKTPALHTFSVSENGIGDDGCVAFIESEPFRRTIKSFDILNNPFDNNTGRRMEHELQPHMEVTCFMYIG